MQAFSICLSGLENSQADGSTITLNTHVSDVEQFIRNNQLQNVTLVGHSYSGHIAGIVASRRKAHVGHGIYMEAFLPENGNSLLDSSSLDIDHEIHLIKNHQGRWPSPMVQEPKAQPDLNEEQIAWICKNFVDHPGQTVTDKAQLSMPGEEISASYIGSKKPDIAWSNPNCKVAYFAFDKGHWPMLSASDKLAELIKEIIERRTNQSAHRR